MTRKTALLEKPISDSKYARVPLLPGLTVDELLERTESDFTLNEAKDFIRTLAWVVRMQAQ